LARESVKKFRKLALGGTFDILHQGHEKILREAFSLSEYVIIGLSTDRLAEELAKGHPVRPYSERKKALEDFLRAEDFLERSSVVPIDSRWGSAPFLEDLDALMVSRETYPVAREINRARRERGLREVEVVVFEKQLAEDGKPISATRIRAGEIDRAGRRLRP
jgi:pantetheine-phosphate adenylyltransferase